MPQLTPQQIFDWVNQPGADTMARWRQLTAYQHYLYLQHKSWLESASQQPYTVGYYDANGAWIVRQRVSGPDYAGLRASYHLWYLARQGPSGQQLLWIDDASPKGDWRWAVDMLPSQTLPPAPPLMSPGQTQNLEPPVPVPPAPAPDRTALYVGLGTGALVLLGVGLLISQARRQPDQPYPREDRIREIRGQLAHDPDLTREEQQDLRREMAALRRELKQEH